MLNSLSSSYRSLALQVTVWLLFAGIAGGLTFMVWVASAVKPTSKNNQNTEVSTVVDPNILLINHNPDEMHKLVQPITFDAIVRDKRNYPKEFKDSRFLKANAGKWTVQVMNVVQHEVITDYLNGRPDRDKFNYFRIVDTNNQKRFVLTYGTFGSPQEAIGTSKMAKFNLPNNVQAFPEELNLYASQIDEYEITPPLEDIGRKAPKSVNLRETKKEIPAPKAEEKTEEKQSIEKSSDGNDTLSVEEKRKVVNPNEPELPVPVIPKQNSGNQPENFDNNVNKNAENTASEKPARNASEPKAQDQKPENKPKEAKSETKPKETAKESKPKEEKAKPAQVKEKASANENSAEKAE